MARAAVVLTNAIDYGWSSEHLRLRKRGVVQIMVCGGGEDFDSGIAGNGSGS